MTTSLIELILNSNVINFAMVAAFVVWIVKKADLSGLINKKRIEIIESINNAEEENKNKQNILSDTKIRVGNLEEEVLKITHEGEFVARNLSSNIIEGANKQAEDLHKKAEASVENQKQVIADAVMTKITNTAFYIAEEHIKQSIDERLHRKYINEFIDNLDKIK